MITDPPKDPLERQTLERRLERGRAEEEARQARLAAQTNQRERRNEVGAIVFIHQNCGREFASRSSLGQHSRWCKAEAPIPSAYSVRTITERLLPPPSPVTPPEDAIKAIHELAVMPKEVSATLPEPPVEEFRNPDGLTFPEYLAAKIGTLETSKANFEAQLRGVQQALQRVTVELSEIQITKRIYEEVTNDQRPKS